MTLSGSNNLYHKHPQVHSANPPLMTVAQPHHFGMKRAQFQQEATEDSHRDLADRATMLNKAAMAATHTAMSNHKALADLLATAV